MARMFLRAFFLSVAALAIVVPAADAGVIDTMYSGVPAQTEKVGS